MSARPCLREAATQVRCKNVVPRVDQWEAKLLAKPEYVPADGRVGMIAPVAFFQTSRTVVRWAEQFGIRMKFIVQHSPFAFSPASTEVTA
jgi:cob(I)alamin adenosyltransferase